jgi:hypothetical protein
MEQRVRVTEHASLLVLQILNISIAKLLRQSDADSCYTIGVAENSCNMRRRANLIYIPWPCDMPIDKG